MKRRGALLPAPALVLLLAALAATVAVPLYGIRVDVEAAEVFSCSEAVPPGHVVMFSFLMNPDFVFPVRIRDEDTKELLKVWSNDAQGFFSVVSAEKKLQLTFDFDNTQSILTPMSVNFDIRIVPDLSSSVGVEQIDPVEKNIRRLSMKMHSLRSLQDALRYRQNDHRTTVEEVRRRVLLWSVLQVVGFLAALGGQLWLFRSFVEKRRTV
ncbi:hypothetical protein CUR178_02669 [Leishmania enriettii]|uniref:GOLD domain-containing protein n=1 Tax=Leishmania enriettii TaxID=5663 RepID=A0A836GEG3_LEIEN|nr:hypothetical protein CUR178_02669 [Leishmania enriettii]